jgi:hypothetical protein
MARKPLFSTQTTCEERTQQVIAFDQNGRAVQRQEQERGFTWVIVVRYDRYYEHD